MMRTLARLVAVLAIWLPALPAAFAAQETPQRVVSLDYCSDQFAVELLPREAILAVSPDASKSFSYLRDQIGDLQRVRPFAEDVLVLNPDLVIRSYGGGPHAVTFFESAGIPVVQVPFADDIDSIKASILAVADSLGVPSRGQALVDEMDQRLDAIPLDTARQRVLYMTPTGVTSGPGTLIHEMLVAAGLENFETRRGWHPLPLERLAYEKPDLIATAFFDSRTDHPALWSAMKHPIAKQQVQDLPTVNLQGAWTSCGGWFLLDAIEALAGSGQPKQ